MTFSNQTYINAEGCFACEECYTFGMEFSYPLECGKAKVMGGNHDERAAKG